MSKIIQIAIDGADNIIALDSDGIIWVRLHPKEWIELDLPTNSNQ